MLPPQLAQSIKSAATRIGFDWCGICAAVQPAGLSRFHQWLESGYHGQMEYLESRREAYSDPKHVMSGARSIVMLALNYDTGEANPAGPGQGRVSRYAWGTGDYHDVIHDKLKQLKAEVEQLRPGSSARGVVDSAPLLEREFAMLAGLGWQGKNTLILNKHVGSWFFLAALLVDFELAVDAPHESSHCGTCRACLEACPTDAFVGPNLLDATRCISYLTIELREPIPRELRKPMGNWLFGCDICQDVCPWNSKSTETELAEFQPSSEMNPVDLIQLFALDDDGFRERFRKTPLWRTRRRGILRNAAIVLGNQQSEAAIPALVDGLHDDEPVIRGASAWALGQIGGKASRQALSARIQMEKAADVASEIELALAEIPA